MTIPALSDLDLATAGATKPLKVCVVSFLGMANSGGVGTASNALIKQLVSDRHRVTLLHTLVEDGQPYCGEETGWRQWVDTLAAQGIALEFIPHQGSAREWLQKSWLVKEFIGKHDFDVVYFNDWHGSGYYSLLAKRVGLAPFSAQLHCVITHASKQWVCASNDEYVYQPSDIEQMGLERRSVEWADVVIGPSRYLLGEYKNYGWRLPARTYHQHYPLIQASIEASDEKPIRIDELVFFGRLEVRKGLWLFCEALDRLAERLRGTTVTFLGPTIYANGISSEMQILNRSAKWPFRVRMLTDFSTEQAIRYLKQGNRLAVMPSLADNSPCVVYECMAAGVPFVTTFGSGTHELIDRRCWPDMMAEPTADALTERLAQILDRGVKLARPSFEPRESLKTWSAWHRYLAGNRVELIATTPISPTAGVQRNASEKKIPLLVMIDEGNCALQLLIENVVAHVKRFGNFATCLVISSRGGAIQLALSDLFEDAQGPSVRFFDASGIDEAHNIIANSEFAFFMDANVEMLAPFFVLALDVLANRPSAVATCVGAVRYNKSDNILIEQMPTGDIPGLSTFNYRIGGPLWAASPKNLGEELSSLEFYDKHLDVLVSASTLGETFMQRRRLANEVVELLPIVGAVTTRDQLAAPQVKTFEETRIAGAALGIAPSLYAGQAPSVAISAFSASSEEPERMLLSDDVAVPVHSLRSLQVPGGDGDLALLAAALGRPELSVQLEVSRSGSAERIKKLVDVAVEATRLRPVFDLADLLAAGKFAVFGQNSFPEKAGGKEPPRGRGEATPNAADAVAIYVDSRLRIVSRKIQSIIKGGTPCKIFFFDVPLCGNSLLAIKLRSAGPTPVLLRIKAVDQQSGEDMGVASARLLLKEACELSLPLYEIYGRCAIVFEFSGTGRMDVAIEGIRVQ
jgi:glycosyltransferase involved in cell wall biosynthesis